MFFTGLSSNRGSFHTVLNMLSLILVFVLVVGLAYFATKYIAKFQANSMNNKTNMRVIESIRIGSNKFIAIVKIGEQFYAVGIGKEEIHIIDKLNPEEIKDYRVLDNGESGTKKEKMEFKEILSRIRKGNSEKLDIDQEQDNKDDYLK